MLASKASQELKLALNEQALAESRRGLYRVFDLKRELPDRWYRFLQPANGNEDQVLELSDLGERLPLFTRGFGNKKARQIEVIALMKDGQMPARVMLSPLGGAPADLLALTPDTTYQHMHRAYKDLTGNEVGLGSWTLKLQLEGATDFRSLPPDAVEELFLAVNYTVA